MNKSNKKILIKLLKAKEFIDRAISIYEKDSFGLKVVDQSHKAQIAIKEASRMIATTHLKVCIAKMIRKGQVTNTQTEIKRLLRYQP